MERRGEKPWYFRGFASAASFNANEIAIIEVLARYLHGRCDRFGGHCTSLSGTDLFGDIGLLACAFRMAETGRAGAGHTNIIQDAVFQIVNASRRMIEIGGMADAPGHIMIGAGCVAADANGADEIALIVIKREALV